MKKIICRYFGHNWRWVISQETVMCIRCGWFPYVDTDDFFIDNDDIYILKSI